MVTINDLLNKSVKLLGELSMTPLLDVQVMLCHLLDVDKIYLLINGNKEVSDDVVTEFNIMLDQRIAGKPVQYIVRHQEFMGLDFYVEEGVLIPRPDTEILIEELIKINSDKKELKIMDLGTGSGAITISLAKFLNVSKVYSMDISSVALGIAKRNASTNEVDRSIEFINNDMLDFLKTPFLNKELDILVSNPPYIPSKDIEDLQIEVKGYEPKIALDGGLDGYDFYREIIKNGHKILKKEGILALEVGHDQAQRIKKLMICANYKDIHVIKDLASIERVVIGRCSE